MNNEIKINKYYSQVGQDRWVLEVLKWKCAGYFVDIGAYDGISINNTYVLEKYYNWSGICVEPNKSYRNLVKNRRCFCENSCISSFDGNIQFTEQDMNSKVGGNVTCSCITLMTLLQKYNSPKEIDYLSIDVEGHEYDVLKVLDFSKFYVRTMTIEHNAYLIGNEHRDKIRNLLAEHFILASTGRDVCNGKTVEFEDWWINKQEK